MKVAIPYYYELHSQLKEMYPEVEWIKVDNASAAFHKVKEGELDALVATQLNSRYMIDHYYPNELYHFLIPGVQNASLSFAFPRGEPELKDIINKALNAIPPSEVLRLTEKWIKMPNVTIDTWDLYSEQFYIVTTLSVLLVGSSLLWGFYLLRSVRRRKVIQGDLENQISFRKALSDSLPNPTYVVNWQGNVISHNSAFEHYFTADYYKNAMLPLENSDSPFKDVFLMRMKSQQKRKKIEQYTHRYLKLIMASRKDALITGIHYAICQQANMLFIFVVGKILPRRVI